MAPFPDDRLLADDYLGDLQTRPMDDIRAMRTECQEAEVGLSYVRRLAQGRIDIVAAELRRRAEGGPPGDLASLIEQLPQILAEHTRPPGPGRLPTLLAPSQDQEAEAASELDAIIDAGRLAALPELTDDEVRGLVDELTEYERSMSERRHLLHERIDALQAELTRRYKTGEASVESLLR